MEMGRPTKFTETCKAKLIEAIHKGATYELACNYARICFATFRKWIIKGEEGIEQEYVDFLNDIKQAEGDAAFKWLAVIDRAMAEGEWAPAAWKLERRHWRSYSKHTEVIGLNEDMDKFKDQMKNKGAKKDGEVDDSIAE